ncbi:hypothetical protein [Roseomonas sp. BN140053]|uniref:hypothetical protein n=1 Tax=Roseomonas sp. BN140053 TaxID=3391898 RepID=UPI0039E75940
MMERCDTAGVARPLSPPACVIGGVDPDRFEAAEQGGRPDELPADHAPDFAPVAHPTLRTGIAAVLAAAGARPVPRAAGL